MIYIIMYLTAIILANISITYLGARATVIIAFLFIGLDLTLRDRLHDQWHKKNLLPKMTVLIFFGSFFSWILNRNSEMIAIASFLAFASSSIVDAVVYQILYKKDYLIKVNASNVAGAFIDSFVFPTIAFGSILPLIILGQFLAKVFGGAIWAFVLNKNNGYIKRE